ncbi:MAG: urea carboxylase-associated family protein [Chloroflexota bacterium]|nr:urea carboxylase-associated family protein [Chloroflexota bacterium]
MPSTLWTYLPTEPSSLGVDRTFYDRLARETDGRRLVERFVVPIRAGRAWPVLAGRLCRIVAIEGPQVADFNAWHLHNPRERFWAARTRQLESSHVTTHNRLWSTLPYLRPMLTITNDTVAYGVDADGGRCHDLLGARCDPYVNKLLTGEEFDFHCHSNLTRAVLPYRLTELDVHDVLNVFQVTGLTADGRYFMKPSPARQGDFLEFFAEIDLLCAISTCPGGDLSVPLWGPDAGDPLPTCRPLGVEVWQPAPELLVGWQPGAPADYGGNHGMPLPVFGRP